MKPLLHLVLPLVFVSAAVAANMHDHIGMELYSLRTQFKELGVPATLDLVKNYGTTEIEAYAVPDVPVALLAKELKARGLNVLATHAGYPAMKQDIVAAIRDAKELGAGMIVVPWLTHSKDGLTEEEAHKYAADFNEFGAACKAAGLKFAYHPHGYEFKPSAKGNGETVFDVMVRDTKPELVSYEMDIFWAFHGGQNPEKLLLKYPTRWVALHLKDIRKGAVTGLSTGSAAPTDNVAVGQGQIDWPGVLKAAQKIGVKYYFIEDETPTPLQCIPDSLKYLRSLKL
jgi:sugar phosphate isomerase/epimerase